MSERDALLAAVLDDPPADLPRMVFADWLDDHGEPAWAEFLRLSCRLAAIIGPQPCPRDVRQQVCLCEPCRLRQRQEQLWSGDGLVRHTIRTTLPPPFIAIYLADEPGAIMQVQNGPKAIVRRGFVERVRLSVDRFVGDPCLRCRGDGRVMAGEGFIGYGELCPVCLGDGRVGGCARSLFAAHPVTSVQLSDVEAAQTPLGFNFYWRRLEDIEAALGEPVFQQSAIPAVLFDRLLSGRLIVLNQSNGGVASRLYPSLAEANAELFDVACVAYGRSFRARKEQR